MSTMPGARGLALTGTGMKNRCLLRPTLLK